MAPRSKLSPDALRDRVLSAVPSWADWPRKLRQLYVLLPVYGVDGQRDACEALKWDWAKVDALIKATPTFEQKLNEYDRTKGYPLLPAGARRNADSPTGWRITNSELTMLLANEQTVIGLVQLEQAGWDASPALAKIVTAAGHYANVDEAAQERKARVEAELAYKVSLEYARRGAKPPKKRAATKTLFGASKPDEELPVDDGTGAEGSEGGG